MKKIFKETILVFLVALVLISCNPDQGLFDQMIHSTPKLGVEIRQLVAVANDSDFFFVSKDGKLYKANSNSTDIIYDSSSEYIYIEQAFLSGTDLTIRLRGNLEHGTTAYSNAIRRVKFNSDFSSIITSSTDMNAKARILTSKGKTYSTSSNLYGLYESEGDVLIVGEKNEDVGSWFISVDAGETHIVKNTPKERPLSFIKCNSSWYVVTSDSYLYRIDASYNCSKCVKISSVTYECASFSKGNDIYFHTGSTFATYSTSENKTGSSNSLSGAGNYDISSRGAIIRSGNKFYIATQSNGIYEVNSDLTAQQVVLAAISD